MNQEFESLSALQPENRLTYTWLDGKTLVKQPFRWVNGIEYTDTEKTEHTVDVIECVQTREEATGAPTTDTFKWVTDMRVSQHNVIELANYGARLRWKIENGGFNVQKNGGYGLTHEYSKNDNSAKIFGSSLLYVGKQCYTQATRPEDRATLESAPSAVAGADA